MLSKPVLTTPTTKRATVKLYYSKKLCSNKKTNFEKQWITSWRL